jgi:biopolymer transport protein ExbB
MFEALRNNPLLTKAVEIWTAGGWAMIVLAITAFLLFWIAFDVWLRIKSSGFHKVSEKKWRRWIGHPAERRGPIGKLIEFAMNASDVEDLGIRFNELHKTELAPFKRDLKFMHRAVGVAPLVGLLGTVTGMLATFKALAGGSGGDATMDMVASGISEALITTETGLMVALPGLFLHYHLKRQSDRYDAFIAHLETVCTQYLVVRWQVAAQAGTDFGGIPPSSGGDR